MAALPRDTDLSFLQGKMLSQVCIGATEVNLHFDDDVSIEIAQGVGHRSAGELMAIYKTSIPAAPMLTSFLLQSIVKWSVEPLGTLVLEFSNQETLEIYYNDEAVDSYAISSRDKSIVV